MSHNRAPSRAIVRRTPAREVFLARLAALFLVPALCLMPLAAGAAPAHPAPAKKTAVPAKPPAHCTCQPVHAKRAKAHRGHRRHLARRHYDYEKAPALAFNAPPAGGGPVYNFYGPTTNFFGPPPPPPPPPAYHGAPPPDDSQRMDPWHGYDGHDGLGNGY